MRKTLVSNYVFVNFSLFILTFENSQFEMRVQLFRYSFRFQQKCVWMKHFKSVDCGGKSVKSLQSIWFLFWFSFSKWNASQHRSKVLEELSSVSLVTVTTMPIHLMALPYVSAYVHIFHFVPLLNKKKRTANLYDATKRSETWKTYTTTKTTTTVTVTTKVKTFHSTVNNFRKNR